MGHKTASRPAARLPRETQLGLYERMVTLRRFELAVQGNYRKGEIPGFIHLYVGEEATGVGVCAHLRATDWITSTHRGHGHALAKGMPPRVLMAELYGKATGCCGGRGGTMHLYDPGIGLFGTNGLVGGSIPHAVGAALGGRARGEDLVAVAFFGDGAVNHGAFHESVNFAGIQNAPVVFVCENNLYATATPLRCTTRNTDVASKAKAYGIPGLPVDGNDVAAVYDVAGEAVERARQGGGPTLIEARTYRTVGHHEGDPPIGVYRTEEEVEQRKERCPIRGFREKLVATWRTASPDELDAVDARVDEVIAEAVAFARASPAPDPATVLHHVVGGLGDRSDRPDTSEANAPSGNQGWLEAVRDGIAEEMRRDPHMLYFGEGTGERGGSFAHTKGLWDEFGGHRVIDTPICELGFTGASIGAAATGSPSVADLMFMDFLFEAGGQVPLQAAKLRYMSNGQMTAPVVLRAPCGPIKNAGPHHSGMYHPAWAHIPGLIVVMPSNPADAKGLMKTALRARDPVLFMEPKALFSTRGEVPAGEHRVPLGAAAMVREGTDLTLVTCGRMVTLCLEAAERMAGDGIECEVIDLRTIVPMDVEAIRASLARTGHLLVVDEGYAMCGIGAEVTAAMMETGFDELDAPVGRLHMLPVTHPFSSSLEDEALLSADKIVSASRNVLNGHAPTQPRSGGEAGKTERKIAPPAHRPAAAGPPSPVQAQSTSGIALTMPHGDLTVTEATVVQWLKGMGDEVASGEPVVEVETDKAASQLEAPAAGKLAEILAPEGTVVAMGQVLAVIDPG